MKSVLDVLEERNFVDAITSQALRADCLKPGLKVYCGFDPTADSLHLGNLVSMVGLAWFQKHGHTPVVVLGGATGMIGDPSGKSVERNLLDPDTLAKNVESIKENFKNVLDFTGNLPEPIFLNNLSWFGEMRVIPFLREIGKLFRMGPMLSKDSVKSRLDSAEGLSYTEFAYQVLQGYDFLHLYEKFDVKVQLGGSDQWGNITAGTELIRKVHNQSAYGLTFPLLTKSDGKKFGKSETGAVWLSSDKLSVYEFYQYLIRVEDVDVIELLKKLTFLPIEEIDQIASSMNQDQYAPRSAQKVLADEVTRLVHGEEALQKALETTQKLRPGFDTELNFELLDTLAREIPVKEIERSDFVAAKAIDLLVSTGLVASKGECRRIIKNGGLYINNKKIEDDSLTLSTDHLIENIYMLAALGKKKKILIRVC